MTIVSNDPTSWPVINSNRISSYVTVASVVIVIYDWALTFGQEIELFWKQRWSLMTFLYLGVRYLGILSAIVAILSEVPTISLTDTVSLLYISDAYYFPSINRGALCESVRSFITFVVGCWTGVLVLAMLWVIMVVRLYAMYQRSKKILIFLVVTLLANNIFFGVVGIILMTHVSGEEIILSGTYQCSNDIGEVFTLLCSITWILGTVWEVLALCFAVWIAVKHFRTLRRHPERETAEDCVTVLMKTHMFYFASFVAVSCLQLIIDFSPAFSTDPYSLEAHICNGLLQILEAVQSFVLGPRLILGLREYNAKLVADFDVASAMTSIAFQEHVHISTDNTV
ncbi:uncharacterized protein EDB93DRAFT_1248728 [Suillus bovinus]|uniref:uncharacterized protein n=1 Tax=Suillus bovinus TaxID=48563 RepID=UPI001B882948|nr:uncharacterized protein EDB93DRAFT_1248728 [Suillus bovinus]KAG2153460.1 hypothetical protein EDB93DRAFT_1248728 [Suillus bovinus]